jgi:hypothetical protein
VWKLRGGTSSRAGPDRDSNQSLGQTVGTREEAGAGVQFAIRFILISLEEVLATKNLKSTWAHPGTVTRDEQNDANGARLHAARSEG